MILYFITCVMSVSYLHFLLLKILTFVGWGWPGMDVGGGDENSLLLLPERGGDGKILTLVWLDEVRMRNS